MFRNKCVSIVFCVLNFAFAALAQVNNGGEIVEIVESFNNKEYSKTIKLSKMALDKNPANDAVNYYLGMAYFSNKENELAEVYLRKAEELDSTNFWYKQRLATLYTFTKEYPKAISVYEKIMRDFPKKHEIYYNLVELYLSQNQQEKALNTLEQIDLVFGTTEATVMLKYDILRRLNKLDEAVEVLREFNEEHSSIRVLASLGDYEVSVNNDSTALAYYDEALSLEPNFPTALFGKAEVFRMTRRFDEYFDPLNKFISFPELNPQWKSRYLTTVISNADQSFIRNYRHKFDNTMNVLVKAHPKDSSALKSAAMYFLAIKDTVKTKELYEKYSESYKDDPKVREEYLGLLMYLKDWKKLSESSQKSYADFPQENQFYDYNSYAEFSLKNYEKVLEILEIILNKNKGNDVKYADAYSLMGDVYYQQGEKSKAYRAYEKSLRYVSDNIGVLNNYAYYLSLDKKKLKKAEVMSRKTIEMEPDNSTYLDTYGWILHLLGKSEEAKTHFKRAMIYGGKENVEVVDHYAEVLYSLGEYDLAMYYWRNAISINNGEIKDLEAKVKLRNLNREKNK